MTKFSLSLFLLFDYDYCFINLAMLPPLLFYTLWHWFSLVTAQIECLCETQRRVCVKETLRIIYKNLQNFEHPLNHFVLSSKILKWYKNSTKGQKFLGLKNFLISEFSWKYCEILRKIQNFAKNSKFCEKFKILQKRGNKFFSSKDQIFLTLGRNLHILYHTIDPPTSKFCRCLIIYVIGCVCNNERLSIMKSERCVCVRLYRLDVRCV